MELGSPSQTAGAQGVIARDVNVTNVGGGYHDHSVTNIINNVHPVSLRDLGPYLSELENHISKGAAHDSYERGGLDAPKCHPETREAVQGQIMGWIGHGDQDETPTTIMWLSGPAGSGKTAIAGSIADACQAKGWLAASFFFAYSGPPDRRSKRCIVPTLAYHLIQQKAIPGLKDRVLAAIADTPSVFEKRMEEQMKILILEPLRAIPAETNRGAWPQVIIIDGLDECDADQEKTYTTQHDRRWNQESNQREIMTTLGHASKDPAFPFQIFIASRPEPAIRDAMSTSPGPVLRLFLDEKYEPDADITLFLEAKFSEIRRRFSIPESWPSQDVIRTTPRSASKGHRMEDARDISPLLYSGLAWLYLLEELGGDLTMGEVWLIRGLLESSPGEMEYLLGNLSSLIDFGPNIDGHPDFSHYHKSFGDFLHDVNRGGVLVTKLFQPIDRLEKAEKVIQNFLEDRVYQAVKHRGTQSALISPLYDGHNPAESFVEHTCYLLPGTISARHEYNSSDIEWWLSVLDSTQGEASFRNEEAIRCIYGRVHKDCHWFGCSSTCKLWRKGIRRHCRASGMWQLPTRKERLVDMFRPYYEEDEFLSGDYEHDFGLRVLKEARELYLLRAPGQIPSGLL